MLEIKKVETPAQWKQFIDFAWDLYKDDPNWVSPPRIAIKDLLDPKKNPFFKHAEIYPLIAYSDGKVVGRILGVIDQNNNEFHSEKAVAFGYFEAINDDQVTSGLVDEVTRWGQSKGMNILRGPINLSTNNECGLLVEGFEEPPQLMMTYNPKYYSDLFEKQGLHKAKDLFAYGLKVGGKFSPAVYRQSERLMKKSDLKIRKIDMKRFKEEVASIQRIYNDAWEKNWGFVPMLPEEFDHMAKDLKMIVDPELVLMAEVRGRIVGFSVTLPDVNQAFKKVPDGKLLPFGLFKLLWFLKGPGRKKTIDRCRVVILGIERAYQELGLGPIFYVETARRAEENGYKTGEASWILEDNVPMNKALERMCGLRNKVYRIYEKAL